MFNNFLATFQVMKATTSPVCSNALYFLLQHTKVRGAYCLGFFKNQDETTLLGGEILHDNQPGQKLKNRRPAFLHMLGL